MKLLQIILLVASCAASALALCKDVKPQQDFDSSKVLGEWFLIAFSGPKDEVELKCTKATFSPVPDESGYISAVFEGISPDGSRKVIESNGTALDPAENGRIRIISSNAQPYNVVIVKTDYTSYMASVMCSSSDDQLRRVYIRSRSRKLPQEVLHDLKKTLEDQGAILSDLALVDQSDCE